MKILFINAPFSTVRPAIGVSLLKSHLERMGVPSRIVHLNMRFARRLGEDDYHYIAELAPSQSLAGDWVFSESLFGRRDAADAGYAEAFAARFGKFKPAGPVLEKLRRAR